MKTEEIKELFEKFEGIVCEYNGVECWSARELYKLLGYVQWRNFIAIVDKAKEACKGAEGTDTAALRSSHVKELCLNLTLRSGVIWKRSEGGNGREVSQRDVH
jgi:hypothetical protein